MHMNWIILGTVATAVLYRIMVDTGARSAREYAEMTEREARAKRLQEEEDARRIAEYQAGLEEYRRQQYLAKQARYQQRCEQEIEAIGRRAITIAQERRVANPTAYFYEWLRG